MRRVWRDRLGRWFAGALLAGPGVAVLAAYGMRLIEARADAARSPGTPAETLIALMVVAVAASAGLLAAWAIRGRMTRAVGVAAWMALVCVAGVMAWTLTRG